MSQTQVVGWGPETSEILVVNDYPSSEELEQGKSLVGSSGRLIANYFKDCNYDLGRCFKTTYIKNQLKLPKAKKKQAEAIREVHEKFKPGDFGKLLASEIHEIQPNVILSIGELATQYLTGKSHVNKLRGSILPLADRVIMDSGTPATFKPNVKVVPMFAPRDIYAKWQRNYYTTNDVQRAISLRTNRDSIRENSLLWIVRDAKSLANWWADRGCRSKFLTVDIETYNGFITCIGFCGDGYEAVCVPLIDKRIEALDRAQIFKLLAKIFKSDIPKINQNIKYDHHVLDYWGWVLNNVSGDTMLLAHCLYPQLPKGLDFLTSIYTEIPYYKDEGRDFNPKQGWDTLFYYNAKDALATWQVYTKQLEEARESEVLNLYTKCVWPCYHVYKKADDKGIRIDEVTQNALDVKYSEMLTVRENNLVKLVNKQGFNFNSSDQVKKLVYNELNLPPQYKRDKETNSNKLTADEETLEDLILNHAKTEEVRDILWGIIWCRKLYKILGYIRTPYFPEEGRMHSSSKIGGTKSGRTSYSETVDCIWYYNKPDHPWYNKNKKTSPVLYTETGLSFQTIPKHGFEIGTQVIGKDIRKMYVPSPGRVFVEGDGGQAEARVVAILAEDWNALDEMERTSFKRNRHGLKDDLHTKTAMAVLRKVFDDITESDRQDFGKKPRHAGNYDMGPARLSLMAHISFSRAVQALSNFHSESPKIREVFHTTVRTLVTNTRLLSTLHGRKHQFFDKLTSETYKQAFSFIPQAVVSDHSKFDTLLPLAEESRDYADFLVENHDSLTFEVDIDKAESFGHLFKKYEETPLIFDKGSFIRQRQLVIPAEIKIGKDNWYEMKELK